MKQIWEKTYSVPGVTLREWHSGGGNFAWGDVKYRSVIGQIQRIGPFNQVLLQKSVHLTLHYSLGTIYRHLSNRKELVYLLSREFRKKDFLSFNYYYKSLLCYWANKIRKFRLWFYYLYLFKISHKITALNLVFPIM